jgi:transposase InsO family protein
VDERPFSGWLTWVGDPFETLTGSYYYRTDDDGTIRRAFVPETRLYVASVLDVGSRKLLGYSMADHMRTELVTSALTMAILGRGGDVAGVIAHADRGSQYTSIDYLNYCSDRGLRTSVGRTGVCWDNSVAESFWASLKRECVGSVALWLDVEGCFDEPSSSFHCCSAVVGVSWVPVPA